MLVTTHYLDEAEHCHRIAIIHAGRLAAIGTTDELKRVFADRPILEVTVGESGRGHARARRDARGREDQRLRHGGARGAQARQRATLCDALGAAPRRERGVPVAGIATRCRRRSRTCSSRSSTRGELTDAKSALAVGRKELRQIARDRRTLLILLFVPAFFLLLYGYALNFDIRHIRLAVDDRDRIAESRALVSAFVNSGYFDLSRTSSATPRFSDRPDGSQRGPRRARDPGGPRADAADGQTAPVQVLLNGDNANTATTVMGYALTILQNESATLSARQRVGRAAAAAGRRSSRASGTTRSCAARCSWCPGSSPTSR